MATRGRASRGNAPRDLKGRSLSFAEWEDIAVSRAAGASVRAIAAQLDRSPSTISRELRRNRESGGGYRASSAHARAYHRASRPKPAKLATNMALRAKVEKDLKKKYSPEQITGRLCLEFPDNPEMRVSPETIYQSLYVQSRSALRRALAGCLRTGRALRHPSRKVGQRKNRIPNMINIAERPAERRQTFPALRSRPSAASPPVTSHQRPTSTLSPPTSTRCSRASPSRHVTAPHAKRCTRSSTARWLAGTRRQPDIPRSAERFR